MAKKHPHIRDLLANKSGNTLVIAAAGMVPLFAMLGGAVDLTRTYLVKSRLQQACDAAVLAGRSSMGNQTWNSASKGVADGYFVSNYNPGRYGTSGSQISYDVGTDLVVHGAATVSVPMVLMQMFGFKNIDLATRCDAKLELPNVDIMFVLDNTLSMGEPSPGGSANKMTALQNAVKSFHSSIENSKSAGTFVRYGFVPYSSTVNVGTLLRPDWLVDRWTYQSRVPDGTDQVATPTGGTVRTWTDWAYVSGSKTQRTYTIASEPCSAPGSTYKTNTVVSDKKTDANGTQTWTETRTGNGVSNSASLSKGVCTVTEVTYSQYVERQYVTEKPNPNAGQPTYSTRYWWKYLPVELDVRPMKTVDSAGAIVGGSFNLPIANDFKPRPITWNKANACIEERQTTGGADAMSAAAYSDLDVDSVPVRGRPETQWRPMLPQVVYSRKQTSLTDMPAANWGEPTIAVRSETNYSTPSDDASRRAACPAPARKLAAITASDLSMYLNTFTPAGMTYHDVGFLWGLRLLSGQGIFAAENQASSTGRLARHLIFMTDGQTETNIGDYDAYGVAALDRRRTPAGRLPTNDEQNALVERRLSGLCRMASTKGITVWVVAFGTQLTPLLRGCAAEDHAFQANNAAELQNAFANIAGGIAQLRLVR